MKPWRLYSLAALLSLGAAAAGYYLYGLLFTETAVVSTEPAPPKPVLNAPRQLFSLVDVDGQSHSISSWDGKVILLNFWASWCPPCLREIPAFVQLQQDYAEQGLQVVGVSIDSPEAVKNFADKLGINYPLLLGQANVAEISRLYGNRIGTLPFTVVIDRQGLVRYLHAEGELDYASAQAAIQPWL